MYSTTRLRDRGQVTIPREVGDELDLQPGDELAWVRNDEGHWELWSHQSLAEVFGFDG